MKPGNPSGGITRVGTVLASVAVVMTLFAGQHATAQTCPFDNGSSTLAREGLIMTRYALGLRGSVLVAGTDIAAVDAPTVEATITCPSCGLDINGNGAFDVTDATIISRKIAGFSGAALTNGLDLGSGVRNTPAAVTSFLVAGCGTTNGTVTSITAGTGLSGGTITTTGTIGIAPGGVGNAELAANAVSNSKLVAGAVTQDKIAIGGGTAFNGWSMSTSNGSLVWKPPPGLSCTTAASAQGSISDGGGNVCVTATCPAGYTVTGGGQSSGGFNSNASLDHTTMYANHVVGNGWSICYIGTTAVTGTMTFTAEARCCAIN